MSYEQFREQCANLILNTERYSSSPKAIYLISPQAREQQAKAILDLPLPEVKQEPLVKDLFVDDIDFCAFQNAIRNLEWISKGIYPSKDHDLDGGFVTANIKHAKLLSQAVLPRMESAYSAILDAVRTGRRQSVIDTEALQKEVAKLREDIFNLHESGKKIIAAEKERTEVALELLDKNEALEEENEQLRQRIAELEDDSRRYQWLKNEHTWSIEETLTNGTSLSSTNKFVNRITRDYSEVTAEWSLTFYSDYGLHEYEDDLDKVIDAALKGKL